MDLDPDRLPPGIPPPTVLVASMDEILSWLLSSTWYNANSRQREQLRQMISPLLKQLQDWAREHYRPFPDIGNQDYDPTMET